MTDTPVPPDSEVAGPADDPSQSPAAGGETRSVELEVEIVAPVAAVWSALTSAEQLANWFPKDARGSAEHGGTVTFSWGEGVEWTTRVEVVERLRRLRWVDPETGGAERPPDSAPEVAVDFTLEGRGGRTTLRLVHSGFSAAADWDDFFDAMRMGWTYFLFNLAHYLARHSGRKREMVWIRRPCTESKRVVWDRLFGPEGLALEDAPSRAAGTRYRCKPMDGEEWEGRLQMVNPPLQLAGTVESLDDSLLFVEFEHSGPGSASWNLGIWLSTYGLPKTRVRALQNQVSGAVDRVLGTTAAS